MNLVKNILDTVISFALLEVHFSLFKFIEDLLFPLCKCSFQLIGLFPTASNIHFPTFGHVLAWISAEFVDHINDSLNL